MNNKNNYCSTFVNSTQRNKLSSKCNYTTERTMLVGQSVQLSFCICRHSSSYCLSAAFSWLSAACWFSSSTDWINCCVAASTVKPLAPLFSVTKQHHHYLRQRRRLCFRCGLFVCLSVGLLANLWTDFDEIFWRCRAWLKDQVIQFWWRSGSRFGSGSPKSEILILRIGGGLCSLSIAFLLHIKIWHLVSITHR